MRAMRAEQFEGYEALKLVELPKPTVTDGKVLVRITAAGVTPLDQTILFGNFHIPEKPLILGNEGAGVVEEGGGADFPAGSRVMFWGTYGAFEDGSYCEWISVRKEDLCLIPDKYDDVSAAGIPVISHSPSGSYPGRFSSRKTVLAPAIGGSVGNAVTQLARALGAKHAISSTTNHAKAEQAKALGFNEVIDTSVEKLTDGVRRITDGYGQIIIDGIGGEVLSEAIKAAPGGSLATLYSASRKTTITYKSHRVADQHPGFQYVLSAAGDRAGDAWNAVVPLLRSGAINQIVAKTFPLVEAAEALRYLVRRPFSREGVLQSDPN